MKLYKNILLFILGTLLGVQCKYNEQSSTSEDRFIIYDSNITFPLPVKISPLISNIQFYRDDSSGEEFIVCLIHESNKIIFYSFNTKKIKNVININFKFKGRSYAQGFDVINFDSIYASTSYGNQLYLINSTGKILNKWEIKDTLTDRTSFFSPSNLKVRNQKAFGMRMVRLRDYFDIFNYTPEVIYDLRQRKVVSYIGDWPVKYKQDKWWHFVGTSYSRVVQNKNKIIFSYPVDHNLYIFDYDTLLKQKHAASKYLTQYAFPPFDISRRKNTSYKVSYVATLGRYGKLLYDPYQELYYRIVLHPQPPKNDEGIENLNSDRPWSIIVLDKNLNVLTEKKFPAKKYMFSTICTTPEGLLVSNDHELNPNFREDRLSFTLFKFINNGS